MLARFAMNRGAIPTYSNRPASSSACGARSKCHPYTPATAGTGLGRPNTSAAAQPIWTDRNRSFHETPNVHR